MPLDIEHGRYAQSDIAKATIGATCGIRDCGFMPSFSAGQHYRLKRGLNRHKRP
ncbi:MAG: hypothetical protein KGZ72_10665 [Roseovarius sp.]|nr:hypothetical protein [Roseovarius sp.]